MRLHARTREVDRAHLEASIHAKQQQSAAKYIIRTERHPDDPEKRGDEA